MYNFDFFTQRHTDYNPPVSRYPYNVAVREESFDMTDVNGYFDKSIFLNTILRLNYYYRDVGLSESLKCVDKIIEDTTFNDRFSNLVCYRNQRTLFLWDSERVVYSDESNKFMELPLPSSVSPSTTENESNIKTYKHLWFIPFILLIVASILISYTLLALTAICSIALLVRGHYENRKREASRTLKEQLRESVGLIDERKKKLIKDYEDYTGHPIEDDVSCGEIEWMIETAINREFSLSNGSTS